MDGDIVTWLHCSSACWQMEIARCAFGVAFYEAIILMLLLLCRELGPAISTVPAGRVRPLTITDFGQALQVIKPSVNQGQLAAFEQWTRDFGTTG